jgi:hypothetical protein
MPARTFAALRRRRRPSRRARCRAPDIFQSNHQDGRTWFCRVGRGSAPLSASRRATTPSSCRRARLRHCCRGKNLRSLTAEFDGSVFSAPARFRCGWPWGRSGSRAEARNLIPAAKFCMGRLARPRHVERADRHPAGGPLLIFKRDTPPQSQAARPNFANTMISPDRIVRYFGAPRLVWPPGWLEHSRPHQGMRPPYDRPRPSPRAEIRADRPCRDGAGSPDVAPSCIRVPAGPAVRRSYPVVADIPRKPHAGHSKFSGDLLAPKVAPCWCSRPGRRGRQHRNVLGLAVRLAHARALPGREFGILSVGAPVEIVLGRKTHLWVISPTLDSPDGFGPALSLLLACEKPP